MIDRRKVRALGGVLLLAMSGCTDWAGYDLDQFWANFPFLSTMRGSVAYEAYELPRLPAPGSVPVSSGIGEVLPSFTQTQLDSVGAALTNPLPRSPEVLARGEIVYVRHCAACHGTEGAGDGPVVGVGRFPMATPLQAGIAATRSDGYLYGIVRVGRGLMPAYGERVTHEDRWAVVHYLRQLQGMPEQVPAVQPIETVQPGSALGAPTPGPAAPVPADTAAVP